LQVADIALQYWQCWPSTVEGIPGVLAHCAWKRLKSGIRNLIVPIANA